MSRVELLDDPAIFNKIATHLKTTSSFTKIKKEAYSPMYEALKVELGLKQTKQYIGWVAEHYLRCIEWVKATYTNGNTLRLKLEFRIYSARDW